MRGQSLIEVLVAVAIGVILLAGGAALIKPAIVQNTQVAQEQQKSALANELLNNVEAWAAGNWNAVGALATSSANHYYLNTSSSPFLAVATSSGESIAVGSSTYTRYFFIDNIYRDGSGNATTATSGMALDPSTFQVTVVVNTPQSGASTTYVTYLARGLSNVANQSSWAGGAGASNPVTALGTQYAAASSTTSTATGSLQLAPL